MLLKPSQSRRKGDKICTVFEYDFPSKTLGFATAKINGRHPEKGRIINTKCDIIYYVVSGKGLVNVNNKKYPLTKGDTIFIKKGSPYFVIGQNLNIILPTSPAWTLKQLKEVK
jgi:mannose-6-phosphate isomerase-like protein (cupin superfamily)